MLAARQYVKLIRRRINWTGDIDKIRNFGIIAHVDHGKSTLADRMLELCGVKVDDAQTLDSLKVERERGITVKSVSASMHYHYEVRYARNPQTYCDQFT